MYCLYASEDLKVIVDKLLYAEKESVIVSIAFENIPGRMITILACNGGLWTEQEKVTERVRVTLWLWPAKSYELVSFDFVFENQHSSSYHLKCSKNWSKRTKWTLKLQLHWNHGFFVNKRLLAKNIRLSSCQFRFYLDFDSRRGLVDSVLAY